MTSAQNHQQLLNGNNYLVMKIFKIVFFVVLFQSCIANAFQQEPYLKHTVKKGETVYSIAKQFQVTPYDIYRLNPDAKEGLKENTVLLIPTKIVPTTSNDDLATDVKKHKVEPKETLFSLAKQYSVSVADLEEWNPDVKSNGLKVGQEIIVSKTYKPSNVIKDVEQVSIIKTSTTVSVEHIVQPQETIYGISKQYNIDEKELIALNPQLKDGLKIGDTIKVKKDSKVELLQDHQDNIYMVQPKETLYGLANQFNTSEEELIRLNPELKDGLREGMVIKIPSTSSIENIKITPKVKKNLVKSIDYSTPKELVMLLPFNLSKIQSDSLKSSKDYIKKSKLLNLTLDFYSGAKIAIDSARKMGLPVKIKILNVESTKTSSNVADVIKNNDFSNVDAVIGPFVNAHAETTATLLNSRNIPVISPLSKEMSKPISNLYNAVPTEDDVIASMLQYFDSKNGNVVAVISGKKESTKAKLQKYPQIKYPELGEKGSFTTENIRAQLVKGKKNFVILDSERAGQIMSITGILRSLKGEYDVQLVTLEVYDTFNFEEIKMTNLTSLNMMYPSVTKEPTTMEEKVVVRKLRDANQTAPNYYVMKGFDVTFDTLLRICQQEGFAKSVEEYSSEGAENGFNYIVKNGVHINNKVYMLYYDTDYTIKIAQ